MQLPGPIAGAPRVTPIAILASLMPSSRSSQSPPTPLIDASYEAVRFDNDWVITLRRAFSRAVKAMVCVPTRRHRQLEAFNAQVRALSDAGRIPASRGATLIQAGQARIDELRALL